MSAPAVHRGGVYWIAAEALRPPLPGHRHPHVVVQAEVLNQSRIPTVVVCALTSNLERASEPGNVLLAVGEANLEKASVVVVSHVSTVDKAHLEAHLGTLSEERVEAILAGLAFQQRAFLPR